ncbi:glutamine-hydrolyzing GMP synthase [Candidatus Peregrinibacteria bacterium]|nr:MAG: glutamine-hydrolyzing GMP synthase [Candidatus Peregrinibacteria bacterium]
MRPIVILDFGSQFAHLIGNRVRRLSAYSEILPVKTLASEIQKLNPCGIILSGGPQSVFEKNSPQPDPKIFDLGIPMLGICYGHQLIAHHFGGHIESLQKEFGKARFSHENGVLFEGVPEESIVWMNHGDSITALPEEFRQNGFTSVCPIAAFENLSQKIFSIQFHPEVTHTEYGMTILQNFIRFCSAEGGWNLSDALEHILTRTREQVGDRNVFLLVSGGVDSSVAFALLVKALGAERVRGLFVDHGLLRKNEADEVEKMLLEHGFSGLFVAHEEEFFLEELRGVTDPEEKRKRIGNAFLAVQQKWTKKLGIEGDHWILGQGTIYPDHIETGGSEHASKIKTHHNRVPEIERMITEGRVIEPLIDLYKDEVREIGRKIGLPEKMISRHPFPGPGLGVRILCGKTDSPLFHAEEIEKNIAEQYSISAKVLPVQSVGVQGDARSYRHPVALFSSEFFHNHQLSLASEIPNSFPEINRTLLCLSQNSMPEKVFSRFPAEMIRERIAILQEADAIIRTILDEEGLQNSVWQFPVVLAPIGISPDTESIILRPIQSENAMTATAVLFSKEVLQKMANCLLEIPEISAVFLDLTSKPPGTIEWE